MESERLRHSDKGRENREGIDIEILLALGNKKTGGAFPPVFLSVDDYIHDDVRIEHSESERFSYE